MVDSTTTIRPLPQNKQPRNPISRKQVEKVISRSIAVFGIVFGAQTIPWLLGQLDEAYPLWLYVVVPGLAEKISGRPKPEPAVEAKTSH